MKKTKIFMSRPFHGTAYNATLRVDNELRISKAQYRKIYQHHKKGECECPLVLKDSQGNEYGVMEEMAGYRLYSL